MKLYLLTVVFFVVALIQGMQGMNNKNGIFYDLHDMPWVVTFWLFAAVIIRAIWRFFNAATVARRAGEIAAKGANHVDTFRDAFKDARNK